MVAETYIDISEIHCRNDEFILQRMYLKTLIYLQLQYLKSVQSFIVLYKCTPDKSNK